MFDITILSIREIKMTKFRSRTIFREFKSLESSGYSNIRPSDIQISEYVRNSELHLRNPGSDTVRYAKWYTSIALRFRRNPRDGERNVDFISILYTMPRLFRLFTSRAWPIGFKKLSIAVPRGVKRTEVPGACYVPTMRILRLRLSGVAYAIPSCRMDIPDSAAPRCGRSVRTFRHGRWVRFLSRR